MINMLVASEILMTIIIFVVCSNCVSAILIRAKRVRNFEIG